MRIVLAFLVLIVLGVVLLLPKDAISAEAAKARASTAAAIAPEI